MSYEGKLDSVRHFIEKHNNTAVKKIDFEVFVSKLKESGGTSEEALRECTWEDLESFGIPRLLAKVITSSFRSKNKEEKVTYIGNKAAQSMSHKQLLENYNLREPSNNVGKRLQELSKGFKFIVFNSDETVNVEASAKLLEQLCDNFPEREIYQINGIPAKTYRVGERPAQLSDVNPLYPNSVLTPDQVCGQTNRSWESISQTVKILIYLAVTKTKEIIVQSVNDAHNIMDMLVSADCDSVELKVRQRYPKSSIMYDELYKTSQLPTLKCPRGVKSSSGSNDPFFGKHRTY